MSTIYSVGTVTVANGGTTVTGVGTSWVGKIFEGDLFTDPAQGLFARVTADATSNTSLTINAWPGVGMTGDAYEVILQADSIRSSERSRQLLEQLSVVQANGRGLFYLFSDSVTDADPGAGYLRLNNATIGSATAAYIDNLDANGATVSAVLDTWDDAGSTAGRGQLWVRSIADPTAFHAFDVTGSVVDGTGYRKLTLEYIGGALSFAADDELMVSFQPSGEAGLTGDAGVGGITLTFDSTTTDADPGAGDFRLNHATHANATAIYIDNVEALAGASITSLLDSWDDGQSTIKGTLTISSKAAPEIFRIYNVTGSVVDGTGYRKLAIAYVTGAGTLTNTTSCSVQFARAGNAGFTPGFRLAFSTTTTDADPGAGIVRFNHATFASITQLYVDNADQGGTTITAWLDSLDDVVNANARAYLRFENVDDPTIYAEFAVTGTVTDGTGYRKIPVSPIVGMVPANGVVLAVNAAKSGADGAGTGDTTGPASSVDGGLVVFNGTSGKSLKAGTALTAAQKGIIRANIAAEVLAGTRNKLDNPDFDIWQRGTSTSPVSGTTQFGPDRWTAYQTGANVNWDRVAFTVGQTDVPGEPEFFAQVTAAGGTALSVGQKMEGVRTLAGRQVTVTGYVKGNAVRTCDVVLRQHFGSGGSSTVPTTFGSVSILNGTWSKFSFTTTLPSISGKTIGANNSLGMYFENFNVSGFQFSIAHVSVVEGDATAEADPFPYRNLALEWSKCRRFYRIIRLRGLSSATAASQFLSLIHPAPDMRATPTTEVLGTDSLTNIGALTTDVSDGNGGVYVQVYGLSSGSGSCAFTATRGLIAEL